MAAGASLPSITGGAAGPSGASGYADYGNILVATGSGGAWFWLSMAAILGIVAWSIKRK